MLINVPQILGRVSVLEKDLGELLIRLCSEVKSLNLPREIYMYQINYNNKKEMIKGMCRELSFHLAWSLEDSDEKRPDEYDWETKSKSDKLFEGHLFPLLKGEFFFSKVKRSEVCVELLQLKDIYKIFERC